MSKYIPNKSGILMPKSVPFSGDPTDEIKVMMYCDYGCTTGFGNVASHFINRIKKNQNFKLVIHAINDFSKEPYQEGENIMVMPTYINEKGDPYGRIQFLNFIYQNDFDIVFILNDVEIVSQLMEHIENVKNQKKKEGRKLFKLITYTPIDSPIRKADLKGFEKIDVPITYTQYAKKIMEQQNPKLKGKIKILPHGVDTSVFYKLTEDKIKEAKIKHLGKENEDAFVFGTVNRNQVRKDIGALLLAFKYFKDNNPKEKAILYLHCNPEDPMGLNMARACSRLEFTIGKDVFFPKKYNESESQKEILISQHKTDAMMVFENVVIGAPIEEVNEVYNFIDVFVNTTTAEGWGLSPHEAMAVGTPVISPVHTSLFEVTNKGTLIEPLTSYQEMIFAHEDDFEKVRYVCDPTEVQAKMEFMYESLSNPYSHEYLSIHYRTRMAIKFAKSFKWSEIAEDFNNIVLKQIGSRLIKL